MFIEIATNINLSAAETIRWLIDLMAYLPSELVAETIEKVRVRGVFRASEAVKATLADRME